MTATQICRISALAASVIAIGCTPTFAQTTPDAGTLLREAERQPQRLPNPTAPAVPKAPAAPDMANVRIHVKAFSITGNTLIAEPELQTVLAPWVGIEPR
jgi:hemolysin activation/secretion protein